MENRRLNKTTPHHKSFTSLSSTEGYQGLFYGPIFSFANYLYHEPEKNPCKPDCSSVWSLKIVVMSACSV